MGSRGKSIAWWGSAIAAAALAATVLGAVQASGGLATQNQLKHAENHILEAVNQDYARKDSVVPQLTRIEKKVDDLLMTRWATLE